MARNRRRAAERKGRQRPSENEGGNGAPRERLHREEQPGSLDHVAGRSDQIGRLAHTFDRMAREVRAREQRMRRQIKELSVKIDEGKRRREVAEITETDYFRDLQQRAGELRGRKEDDP